MAFLHQSRRQIAAPNLAAILSKDIVLKSIGDVLDSRDLAHLCSGCLDVWQVRSFLLRSAMEAQHGLSVPGSMLADLRFLEDIKQAGEINFRCDSLTVQHGSQFRSILVGGRQDILTFAQCPPRRGDCWSSNVSLRKGSYSLDVSGWRNPAHGILDIFLDGVRITPAEGIDWLGRKTEPHSVILAPIDVRWSGTHRFVGKVSRTNSELDPQARYWMCLNSLTMSLLQPRFGEAAPLQKTEGDANPPSRSAKIIPSALSHTCAALFFLAVFVMPLILAFRFDSGMLAKVPEKPDQILDGYTDWIATTVSEVCDGVCMMVRAGK